MIETIYHKMQEFKFDVNGQYGFVLTGMLRKDGLFNAFIVIDPDLQRLPGRFREIIEATASFIFECGKIESINLSFLRSEIRDKKLMENMGFREGQKKRAFEATYILDRLTYIPSGKN